MARRLSPMRVISRVISTNFLIEPRTAWMSPEPSIPTVQWVSSVIGQ
jgi:hypothetical protein